MNRRAFLFGGAVASAAALTIDNPIKTIVGGHTKDAISRFTHNDEFAPDATTVASGMFDQNAPGRDLAHWADGTASLSTDGNKFYIQLGADFNSGPLPDGWVCIHTEADRQSEEDTFTEGLTYIQPLKAGSGAQFYEITKEQFLSARSITIVCRAFQEYIGSATLT